MILGQRGMLDKSWLPPFGRDQTTPLFFFCFDQAR
jgi:hypothetical protein